MRNPRKKRKDPIKRGSPRLADAQLRRKFLCTVPVSYSSRHSLFGLVKFRGGTPFKVTLRSLWRNEKYSPVWSATTRALINLLIELTHSVHLKLKCHCPKYFDVFPLGPCTPNLGSH